MLTRKQTELLLFINERLIRDGVSPSFEEMKEALALKSKSGIHRLITGLEERGFLRRLPHRARALEVLRLPDSAAYSRPKPNPAVIVGGRGAEPPAPGGNTVVQGMFRPRQPQARDEGGATQVPLFGRIAAGMPVAALRDPSSFLDVPPSMLGRGKHYALEVAGDSMIDAGILDGDMVLIEECDAADPGSIVVALVDNEEVTLKRLRRHKGSIALEPANRAYETRIFPPDRVQIQGRLVALIRHY